MTLAATARTSTRRSTRVQVSAPARLTDGGQAPAAVRCAIYTRKSTTEGLDSDFSSLDNQREACESYIRSQRSEGWELIEDRFDDGGFSGGNIERPALQRLLTGIDAGQIDCVVVYKIDRLSRSLLDFVRLMEVFEQRQVAFVAVTQQINTTTSAGRLMLNVLMSFAQFEREIIAERTSDKMCAARRKGKWCGGPPVLGYDIDHERKRLVVNPDEAEQVREVFDLYLEKQSMLHVVCELNRRGWTTKSYQTKTGSHHPGAVWDKSKLQRILINVTYIGKTRHHGEVIDAEHEGIVDPAIFQQVQELIRGNGNGSGSAVRNKHGALLKGILRCGQCGAAMAHTYTKKGNRLYRYYTCTTYQKQGPGACTTRSLPAQEIEDFVVEQIRRLARDPDLIRQVFKESIRQRQEQLTRLESERKRLVRQRQQKDDEIRRLVGAIAGTPNPSPALSERLSEMERQAADVDRRLQEIGTQASTLRDQSIDLDGVTAALEEFEAVWGVMGCTERAGTVNSLVSIVACGADTTLSIDLRTSLCYGTEKRAG